MTIRAEAMLDVSGESSSFNFGFQGSASTFINDKAVIPKPCAQALIDNATVTWTDTPPCMDIYFTANASVSFNFAAEYLGVGDDSSYYPAVPVIILYKLGTDFTSTGPGSYSYGAASASVSTAYGDYVGISSPPYHLKK